MQTVDVLGFGVGDPTWLYVFVMMAAVTAVAVIGARLLRKKL